MVMDTDNSILIKRKFNIASDQSEKIGMHSIKTN